jgi:hypothetical protein
MMEDAMTQQIRNPISSEQVSFAGRALDDNELDAISGGVTDTLTLTHLTNEAINNLAGGLQSAPPKK